MRSNVQTDRVAQHQQRLLPRQPIPLRIPCACEVDNANDVQTREVRTTVQSVLQAGSTTVNGDVQRTEEQSNISDERQKAESYRAVQSADGAEQLVETASSPDPNVQATRTISARTLYIGYLSAEVDTSDINYGDTNRLNHNKNHLQGKTVITTDNNASSRPNASLPVVDVPIAREELTAEDLRVPTRAEIEEAVRADFELQEDKQWLDTGVVPTGDAIAAQRAKKVENDSIAEQPNRTNLQIWLQIIDRGTSSVSAMDNRVFSRLVWALFEEQFPHLRQHYQPRLISNEELFKAVSSAVKDSSGTSRPDPSKAVVPTPLPSTLDLEMRPIPCDQHGEQTHQQRIHPDLSVFESSNPQVGGKTRPRVKLRNNGRNGTERSSRQRSESSWCGARSNTSRASSTSRTSQSSRIAVQTAEFDTGDGWSSSASSGESASESKGAATTERMRRESAPAATQNAVQHPKARHERPRRRTQA